MKYFAYISSTYVSKNKLGEQLSEEIKKFDRTLLNSEEEKNEFVQAIKGIVLKANQDNPRCKSDGISVQDFTEKNGSASDYYLLYPKINQVFMMNIMPVYKVGTPGAAMVLEKKNGVPKMKNPPPPPAKKKKEVGDE
ncbi:hypothetical protein [Jiulongibacter sediminis]|uniref:hypothetical protein n=1 Tax=Jiulongibacter sediminis TaxID=1605367 RepID=UPI0026EE6507|nr:hypothetical protein [Jiulongibacter sediminis]